MLALRVALVLTMVVIGCRRVPSPPAEAPPDVARWGVLQPFSATA